MIMQDDAFHIYFKTVVILFYLSYQYTLLVYICYEFINGTINGIYCNGTQSYQVNYTTLHNLADLFIQTLTAQETV